MPGRTGQQCAQRWRHKVRRAPSLPARAVGRSQRPARPRADDCRAARVQVNPIIRKDKWTEEEDQKVRLAAHPHPHPWRSVARGRRRVPSLCATVFCGGRILWGGWEGVKGKRQWRAHTRARRGHARARAQVRLSRTCYRRLARACQLPPRGVALALSSTRAAAPTRAPRVRAVCPGEIQKKKNRRKILQPAALPQRPGGRDREDQCALRGAAQMRPVSARRR